MRKLSFILISVLLLGLLGCNKATQKQIQSVDFRFHRGQKYFDDGKYYKAIDDFNFVVLNSPGSEFADDAQLYIGDANFNLEQYVVAASEYRRLLRRYPESPLVEQAQYKLGMCFVKLSPKYKLEQNYTHQAIETMQNFLEEFPNSTYKDEITGLIDQLRAKLAHKRYSNAHLYYVLRQYDSAIIYLDELLEQYYDTPWANRARLLKAKSLVKLGREAEAQAELEELLNRSPKEDVKTEAEQLLNKVKGIEEPVSQARELE